MTSISSLKATGDPFGLPPITCAWCHVVQQLWRQKLWRCQPANLEQSATWPANTDISYKHFKTLLKTYMFGWATALCDILYKRLRNTLTYLLTYSY